MYKMNFMTTMLLLVVAQIVFTDDVNLDLSDMQHVSRSAQSNQRPDFPISANALVVGAMGLTGLTGLMGPTGATGATGSAFNTYAYVYNLADPSTPTGSAIVFNNNGPMSNVTHTLGSDTVTILETGVYCITLSVEFDLLGGSVRLKINGNEPTPPARAFNLASQNMASNTFILSLNAADLITVYLLNGLLNNANSGVSASISLIRIA